MKYVFLAVLSVLAIVAQMIAGNNFFLFNYLDLSLILVAYWAVYRSRIQALFVGSLTGLILDAVMGWPIGYNGFGRTLAAYAIGQSWKRFNTREPWVRFSIIAASSCLSSLSMFVLFRLMQRTTSKIFFGASLMQALISAGISIVVFACLETYQRIQTHKVH
jgi:rod shape-determining protein MreD